MADSVSRFSWGFTEGWSSGKAGRSRRLRLAMPASVPPWVIPAGTARTLPTLKIGPVAAGRRRMNQALHSRVLKDSMVTLYSSASGFLIARRATASWFNLSKWSATLKAAPSQLAAAG